MVTIHNFLFRSRSESIKSLEFFYFIHDLFVSLVSKYGQSNNSLILDFLRLLGGFYLWESKKIEGYTQALKDSVFWESRQFYRETMITFISGELTALEFAGEFYDRLLLEKAKADDLLHDYKQQVDIKLSPKSFQFSKIILSFELPLEAYQDEMEEVEDQELSQNDLTFTEDYFREAIANALEEVNKYFPD